VQTTDSAIAVITKGVPAFSVNVPRYLSTELFYYLQIRLHDTCTRGEVAGEHNVGGDEELEIVASSEGPKKERIRPVPPRTGLLRPVLGIVSVPEVVWRMKA
jgi:hypothetical protein